MKHAKGSRVEVRIDYLPSVLRIEVRDFGGPGTAAEAPGSGLVGMRQRVGLLGGSPAPGPTRRAGSRSPQTSPWRTTLGRSTRPVPPSPRPPPACREAARREAARREAARREAARRARRHRPAAATPGGAA